MTLKVSSQERAAISTLLVRHTMLSAATENLVLAEMKNTLPPPNSRAIIRLS